MTGDNVLWSASSLKFLMRIGTPRYWEQAIFLFVLVPLFLAGSRSLSEGPAGAATVIVWWALTVWIATFVARYEFQTHANPHYLRFFVLLYSALLVMVWRRWRWHRWSTVIACALLAVIWIKGFEQGVKTAILYQTDNQHGYRSLIDRPGEENDATALVYPRRGNRLTRVLIPRLTSYEPYGYRRILGRPE